ncbi:MAG: thioredoxin domain-containing protein [bacterium]
MEENASTIKISTPVAIIILGLIIAGAFALSAAIYMNGEKIKDVGQAALVPAEEVPAGISLEGQPMLGDPAAKVTIIEVSDFQCFYCGMHENETFPQIEKEYVATGKVKVVFINFPLYFHEYAEKAAEAAECAFEQGKFWEYKELLFKNQDALDIQNLKTYAQNLGLDGSIFNACLDSGKFAKAVEKDFQAGQDAGVSGTPTFFINGEELVGAQPFSEFQRIIESKLNQ